MAAMTDAFENRFIDWFFRAQSLNLNGSTATAGTGPANLYVGLLTAAPSDSSTGTEVTGGSYARQGIVSALANWAGTQSAGSTSASSGNTGTTSNNNAVTFPVPSANWGLITHFAIYDSLTTGVMLFHGQLTQNKNVSLGDAAPSFAASALIVQIDN